MHFRQKLIRSFFDYDKTIFKENEVNIDQEGKLK